uniref:L-xylulose reductase n=1 Tax=Plectus sambesii TaxID=2011161 RepID=A0A914XKL4_9BILA
MKITFDGKRALVTGATQGIGRGIALALAENGAKVVALGRNEDLLQSLKAENSSIEVVKCDVTGDEKTIRDALAPFQPFDLLVNNAGIAVVKPFLELSPDDIDAMLTVNVKGAMIVAQIVAKEMVAHQIKGSIVHLSSQASAKPLLGHAVYCASKAALDMLGRVMALELGEYGIRVNCVNPTVVLTEMGKKAWSDPAKSKPLLDKMPIKRFAEVEDVVNAVMFLLSDCSAMTTGAIFPVDGGYMAV